MTKYLVRTPARQQSGGVRRQGFTLMEILITISVIAVLLMIMLPVFARVREQGRTTTCASNLRQLGQAVQFYAQDNSDYLPSSAPYDPTGGGGSQCAWVDRIERYVKSPKTFECPSLEAEYRSGCPTTPLEVGVKYYHGGYGMNNLDRFKRFKTTHIARPSSTVFALDRQQKSAYSTVYMGDFSSPVISVSDLEGQVPRRHRQGVNVLMVDGRAKWFRLDSLADPNMWRPN